MTTRVLAPVLASFLIACATPTPQAQASPSPAPSPLVTKHSATQAPLPVPTYVRWAVDGGSGDLARPFRLGFFYDGVAASFRVVDPSGQTVLRVPIAGSGVFGPETCVQRVRTIGAKEGYTYVVIDAATLQRFAQEAATYRIEAEGVSASPVTLALIDSGCRPL